MKTASCRDNFNRFRGIQRETFTYSVAIRTLGLAGDKFRKELESIFAQTVPPERVVVYIAEGYERPSFTVGNEDYVWVKKGMMAQRVLRYDEIDSDCILMLDDDVLLAPDCVEKMLRAMMLYEADCVGVDTFQNHQMSIKAKIYAAVTNLVFPHWSRKWAFKIHRNGSFSYNNHPIKPYYLSQSCGGPASFWKKEIIYKYKIENELWLEQLGYSYGEDTLMFYKIYRNGGNLGILYDSGIINQDAQSSSGSFRKSDKHIYTRTKASFMIWWRICYKNGKDTISSRAAAALAYGFKAIWLIPVVAGAALVKRDWRVFSSYFKGLQDGWKEVHSEAFQNLPPYIQ